jgi:hypothetical protein
MYFDQLFMSSCRSAIQLFINLENFSHQIQSNSLTSNRFVSGFKVRPIQKNLKSFSLEDFSDLPNVLPSYLQSPQTKPSEVLKFIIQEFKDSPSAFADLSTSKNFLKMKASSLLRAPLNEFFQVNSKSAVFLEVVWDVSPSASLIVDLVERLEKSWPLELQGLIACRGFYHTAFIKSKASWKSFDDGRLVNWLGLVAGLVSSVAQPVLLYLKQDSGQPPRVQDLTRLREFAKLQDSRLQTSFVETCDDLKDFNRQEGTRGTSRDFYGSWNFEKGENKDRATSDNLRFRHRSSQPEKSFRDKNSEGYLEKEWRNAKDNQSSKVTEDSSNVHRFSYRTENLESSKGSKGSSFFNPNFTEKFEAFERDRLEKSENNGKNSFHSKSTPLSFKVVETNKGQMAEIRMVGLQGPCKALGGSQSFQKEASFSSHPQVHQEDKREKVDFQKSYYSEGKGDYSDSRSFSRSENRLLQSHTPQGRSFQDFNLPESHLRESHFLGSYSGEGLKHELNDWLCPKCSGGNMESVYECSSCRFINWDRFYAIKAKTVPGRSGSIPAKTEDRYSKTVKNPGLDRKESFEYRPSFESDFNRSQFFWDEDRRRNTCSSYFTQGN